jgi:hypothetical protein
LLVPWRQLLKRDVTAGTSGGNLIGEELEISQHLLGSSALRQVGCRVLSDLGGNVRLARTAQNLLTDWLPENAAAPERDPLFESVTVTPHRVGAVCAFSDQWFRQTGQNGDQILIDSFAQSISQQIDYAGLLGRGVGQNEPLGLANNPLTIKPPLDIDWPWYTEAESAADDFVASGNAFGLVAGPRSKKLLQDTMLWAGISGPDVWSRIPNKSNTPVLLGQSAAAGPWQLAVIAVFGPALDIVLNPFTRSREAIIELVVSAWVDFACRLPQSFTITIDPNPPPRPREPVIQTKSKGNSGSK